MRADPSDCGVIVSCESVHNSCRIGCVVVVVVVAVVVEVELLVDGVAVVVVFRAGIVVVVPST